MKIRPHCSNCSTFRMHMKALHLLQMERLRMAGLVSGWRSPFRKVWGIGTKKKQPSLKSGMKGIGLGCDIKRIDTCSNIADIYSRNDIWNSFHPFQSQTAHCKPAIPALAVLSKVVAAWPTEEEGTGLPWPQCCSVYYIGIRICP